VKKEIVTKGAGEKPKKGQMITAHYTGKLLDGTVFDSSRQRNKYFNFKVGLGQVIQAWDSTFLTMQRGERAVITASPDAAYGEDGYPPVIPENSTLVFDVELIDFK
jgi:FKBP-type peptidyl-prolyl cis-trans isomerase